MNRMSKLTRFLAFSCMSATIAQAGWCPIRVIDPEATVIHAEASQSGAIVLALDREYPNPPTIWRLTNSWASLQELPNQPDALYDFALSGESIVAATSPQNNPKLIEWNANNQTWTSGVSLFPVQGGAYFTKVRLAQIGANTYAAGELLEEEYCGDAITSVHGTRCSNGSCQPPSTLLASDYFRLDLLEAAPNPESTASAFYSFDYSPPQIFEKGLPNGQNALEVAPDADAFTSQNIFLMGQKLRMVALDYIAPAGSNPARYSVVDASRAKNATDWSESTTEPTELASARSLETCVMGENIAAVWLPAHPENTPQNLAYSILSGSQWSEPVEIPGTDICFDCPPYSEALDSLALACTGTEIHLFWSTLAHGVRHTALAPLALTSVQQEATDVLKIYGRGFSQGLTANLEDQALEVLEVRTRFIKVRLQPQSSGLLTVRNPNGETASIALEPLRFVVSIGSMDTLLLIGLLVGCWKVKRLSSC